MRSRKAKVLVLDGMWNKSLAAVRSLGKRGFSVTAGERTRLATALFSKYCNERLTYPSVSLYPYDFIDAIEKELMMHSYDVIFPMEFSTQIILTNDENRKRLEQYTRIPFADAGLAKNINDKAFIMRYAIENGIDIPATYFINDIKQLSEASVDIRYPAIIKPRDSSGSRGMVYVKNSDELISAYSLVHNQHPLPIIQECIPIEGDTYGVGLLLNFNSEVRASFVYKRLRSYPIKGGPSTLRESVKRNDVREIAESLMKSLRWTGIAHVEFKVDPRDGLPKLLEVNPRFWGSLPLAIESGIDFPFLLYSLAMNGDIKPVSDYRTGVKCRWLIPGDILHFLKSPNRLKLCSNFFNFKIKDDILAFTDPLPTIGRILSAFTLIFDREMRGLLKR